MSEKKRKMEKEKEEERASQVSFVCGAGIVCTVFYVQLIHSYYRFLLGNTV